MRTVLVTGAGGFIGSSVLKLLDKNPDKIHAVSRTVLYRIIPMPFPI
ncbi:NAD-dependent epimerase/dehydratase family protein [Paenibacillus larvae]